MPRFSRGWTHREDQLAARHARHIDPALVASVDDEMAARGRRPTATFGAPARAGGGDDPEVRSPMPAALVGVRPALSRRCPRRSSTAPVCVHVTPSGPGRSQRACAARLAGPVNAMSTLHRPMATDRRLREPTTARAAEGAAKGWSTLTVMSAPVTAVTRHGWARFGPLSVRAQNRRLWRFCVDGPPFELPAAPGGAGPRFGGPVRVTA